MNAWKKYIVLFAFLQLLTITVNAQFYNGSHNTFGQNRVQYNPTFWQSYNFQRFEVYFTASGKQHAEYAAKSAHKALEAIERYLDYTVEEKLQIVVFNTQSAFRQSNIGLRNDEETNIGGVTRVDGNKVFVYYEGDHEKMDRQIRSGIANILVMKLLYGDNWRQALKNSALVTFPDWFTEGFVKYMEGEWTTELDNEVKDNVMSGKYDKFNRLFGEEKILAGMAIWNYISEVYGERMIPNILYMTRVSRNIESGFLYVLGVDLRDLSRDFVAYYKERYKNDDAFRERVKVEKLPIKIKKNRKYQQLTLSPDSKYAAFTTNELGQYKVWLYDFEKDKLKKIAKGEHKLDRLPDYSHPVLAWHPTSKVLAFVEEKKGELLINLYDVEDEKNNAKPMLRMEKVLSMSYSDDGKKLIMAGVNQGQTDIYLYNVIGNNQKQLTNDIYDDLMPEFIDNSTRVIFVSNRDDDTLRKKTEIKPYRADKDVFILDLDHPKRPLTRITNTPYIDETYPNQYDDKHYSYLSNENGISNRFMAYYDSAISHIDTTVHYRYFSVTGRLSNYARNVLEYKVDSKHGFYSMLMKEGGGYVLYKGKQADDLLIEEVIKPTRFMDYKLRSVGEVATLSIENVDEHAKDPDAVDIDNYLFEDERQEPVIENLIIEVKDSIVKQEPTFELPRTEIYKVNYTSDYVVSQLDNSFLNQNYQRIVGNNGYQNPGFNALMKIGMIDLFEDHRIIGGYRFPVNFSNSEYLLVYENLKSRLDKKYLASRQVFRRIGGDNNPQKLQTIDLKYNLKFPFSEVASLRFTANGRHDRTITLTQDPSTLEEPNINHYLLGSKLEYVFDNTRNIGLNIKNGTRYKVWGEYFRELNTPESDLVVLGLDVRHYQKIHREIVFATRLAASTSLGSQRLLYYMGGVDNWLTPRFNSNILPDPNKNYQFQTIATPLRGFSQNIRNGNNFALVNAELRFPLVKYFSHKPVRSSFLENFMLIGFSDVGTAWTGLNPYTSENAFNTELVQGFNYVITIQNQREPIVYGYGMGMRTKLFGYYVRFDWAWGVDDGVVQKSVKYLSFSLDF